MSWSDSAARMKPGSGCGPSRAEGAGHDRVRRVRSTIARILLALPLVVAVAGCGFQLRGDVHYAFSTLYVNAPAASPIGTELKRTLEANGTTLVDTAPAAQVTLDISGVADDKQVLSLSGGGRVREYQLIKRVTFAVHDANGHDWLPAGEVVIRRAYSFNESEVLAREAQEARMLKEMQSDAVQQIVRRLQSAKNPA
jgi:LPS-assembly lipoprotein